MKAQAPYKSIEGLMATEAFMASRTKNSFVLESYFSFLGPLFTKVWFDLDPNLPNLAGKIHISANPCWRVHTCPVDRCTRVGTVTRNVSPILVSLPHKIQLTTDRLGHYTSVWVRLVCGRQNIPPEDGGGWWSAHCFVITAIWW